jgi:hypothetical protein
VSELRTSPKGRRKCEQAGDESKSQAFRLKSILLMNMVKYLNQYKI